jgi:hypothetical protein
VAFYEIANVRLNIIGDNADTTYDTLFNVKGAEADQYVKNKLFLAIKKQSNIAVLPIIDTSAGTINGTAITQDVKAMATDRATALVFNAWNRLDSAKEYFNSSETAIAAYIAKLDSDNGASVLAVV